MYLKRITLQGYKSFAEKTEFEFAEGITAIIGPNGTGKSNIADGIRWALGERSMTTLRAKSSADMIFVGGDGRSRAGMAQVSLTFDNTDASLPIDFSEVTISRRAYRSGENEYLINGSQILLRDIEELLAGSSLSERTYTVIGQGLVDAALSLRPDERRALFEEAAGIALYRDRRERTVQRLDETERNLDRVRDIMSEVAPLQRRLERDAERVEQHRRFGAHLERLQRTWYGYRWGQRQGELAWALEEAVRIEEMLTARRADVSTLTSQVHQVRERSAELRGQLRDWYRRSADLHDEVDRARRQLAVSEERERLLKTRREELLEEIGPLEGQRTQQADQVAELRERMGGLAGELEGRRRRLARMGEAWTERAERAEALERERLEVEGELRDTRERIERLDQDLSQAREETSRLVSEQAVAQERVRQLEGRRAEALAQIEPLRQEEEEQSRRLQQNQAQLGALERSLAERQHHLDDLEAEWQAWCERREEPEEEQRQIAGALDSCRSKIDALERALEEAQEEEAGLTGEFRALERLHASGAAYGSGVGAVLEADIDGLLGALIPLLEVPYKWEHAIGAVLGSEGPPVLLEERTTVERIHRLLGAEGGRLRLLILDARVPRGAAHPMPSGVLSAAEVVTCEARVRPAVDALLAGVALCDDLSEATKLRPELPAGSCCVTQDGIVLCADGSYIVGGGDSEGGLAFQRARRELPAQLAEVGRRVTELEGRRQSAMEEVASAEARLAEIDRRVAQYREDRSRCLQEELSEARTAIAVAREALRRQRSVVEREASELERVRSRRQGAEMEADDLKMEQAAEAERARALELAVSPVDLTSESPSAERAERFRGRYLKAHQRLTRLEAEHDAAVASASSLEDGLRELASRAAEAREEASRFERETLSEARTAVAVSEASLESLRQAVGRESALLERVSTQVDARLGRAEELKVERETLVERIAGLREEASRLEGALQEVRMRLQPAEDELEELNSRQRSLETKAERAQERAQDAEERHGRAQLQLERRRDELRLLADRIDEDLGLVELELGESFAAQAPLPMRPLVSELPVVEELPEGLESEMQFVRKRLRHLGAVNPNAPAELAEVRKRYDFLREQAADLQEALAQLRGSVVDLDRLMETAFKETFDAVAKEFAEIFSRLFDGGEAQLALTDPDDLLNTGVDIVARPPGKRSQRLALLSGGERALTATALLFSLLEVSATPFCVLDEVDAMLDEANVGRFRTKLEELAQETQFIVITHNRGTVESARTVYGVSMGSDAVSQVVSLRIDEAEAVG